MALDLSTFYADLTVEWKIMHVPALFEPAKVQCEIGDVSPMCHATCLSPICLDIALFFSSSSLFAKIKVFLPSLSVSLPGIWLCLFPMASYSKL